MPSDPIKHVVVLMLENHSFDQMLGCMSLTNSDIDGIDHSRFNIDPRTNTKVFQLPVTTMVNKHDPAHELKDTLNHLKENNSHFVSDYVKHYPKATAAQTQEIMGYYPKGSLPTLHTLAENFLVCDRWFSSLPGPTWPNRFFVHSGTSLGHVDMPTSVFNPGWHLYNQTTIYDLLKEAKIPWRIYFDGIPQSLVMTHQLKYTDHYIKFSEFEKDCKKPESTFPAYVFIEPDYAGIDQNDQHSPSNILNGDAFLGKIYNALRSNEDLWNSTLFIVVYDEDGGFYDHVTPPSTGAPDDSKSVFSFEQLGVRVPAILISPYVITGSTKEIFDHTSILKYLCVKWNLPVHKLGLRATYANNFAHVIQTTAQNSAASSIELVAHTKQRTQPIAEHSNAAALIGYSQYLTKGEGCACDLRSGNKAYDIAYNQALDIINKKPTV